MRIAIISDIHEDLEYLEKAMDQITKLGSDMICCLGDILGYSSIFYTYESTRNASACLQLVREKCQIIIPGNHDLSACNSIPEHSGVFDYPENWYEMDFDQQRKISDDQLWLHEDDLDHGLGTQEQDYLASLPEFAASDLDTYRVLFSHYVYPNLSGMRKGFYSWAAEYKDHFYMMKDHDCTIGITGHVHPDGMLQVTKNRSTDYPFNKWISLKKHPVLFSIPAIHRQRGLAGFCMLDTDFKEICAIKIQ